MRLVVQRVLHSEVCVDNITIGSIGKGLLVFLGIGHDDTPAIADKLIDKLERLRIFEDSCGKTNLSIKDVGGELLIVSQFTLYADCRHGNRPGFSDAAAPEYAEELYEYFKSKCIGRFSKVSCGKFGADMKVSLENDGPFTLVLDSKSVLPL